MFIFKPRASAFKRTLLACSAVAAIAAATPAVAQSSGGGAAVSFAIESQPMEEALTTLARDADVQVLFAPEAVRGRRANPVVGVLTPAEALRQMVGGTGLTVTPVGARTFSVTLARADAGPRSAAREPPRRVRRRVRERRDQALQRPSVASSARTRRCRPNSVRPQGVAAASVRE